MVQRAFSRRAPLEGVKTHARFQTTHVKFSHTFKVRAVFIVNYLAKPYFVSRYNIDVVAVYQCDIMTVRAAYINYT